MKLILNKLLLGCLLICCAVGDVNMEIKELMTKADSYYNQSDYGNAIIIYEDLLAKQESAYGTDDFRVAETLSRLGELYSLTDMSDIGEYYFQQSISIFEKSFRARKDALELPLLNLLKIYSLQKDTLMAQLVQNQLQSITVFFQTPQGNHPELFITDDSVSVTNNDMAIDMMELGLSYINRGLFSEAADQFSQALNYRTENIDLNFLLEFFPDDSIFNANLINAFSFYQENDSSGASYFYQALFQKVTRNIFTIPKERWQKIWFN